MFSVETKDHDHFMTKTSFFLEDNYVGCVYYAIAKKDYNTYDLADFACDYSPEFFKAVCLLNDRMNKGDIFIDWLFVEESMRNKKIGKKLIDFIEKLNAKKIFFLIPERSLEVENFYNKSFENYVCIVKKYNLLVFRKK